MRFYATPPVDGALCDYVTIGAGFAHPVPDSVSDDAAALCEPLSVGIAAVRKADIDGGSRVLIAGAGPIGIMITQLARAYGATDVVVSDPDEPRRERALSFGATASSRPGRRGDRRPGRRRVHRRLRRRSRRRARASARCARPATVGTGRLGRRVDGAADPADPEPGAGAHRGVPVREYLADGDRPGRVRAGRSGRHGDCATSRWRRPPKRSTPTGRRVASSRWWRSHEAQQVDAGARCRSTSRATTATKSVSASCISGSAVFTAPTRPCTSTACWRWGWPRTGASAASACCRRTARWPR